MNNLLIAISLVIFGTILGALGAFFLKVGGTKIKKRHDLINPKKNYLLASGVILYGFSVFPFTFALKFADLSILYPMVSLSYIWAALLAIIFLKEKINIQRWIGISFIILGVIVISFA